jgi:catechol 2,3-dioxygenase-like lactoylglutathione lyase family enzyme
VLHHASLPVADLERASELYDAALAPLGYRRVADLDDFVSRATVCSWQETPEDRLFSNRSSKVG